MILSPPCIASFALALTLLSSPVVRAQNTPLPSGTKKTAPKEKAPIPQKKVRIVAAVVTRRHQTTAAFPRLVGPSGQLYHPVLNSSGDLRGWKRTSAGGVSIDVIGVFENDQEQFYALGRRAPLFLQISKAWSAYPLRNRGQASASAGHKPFIAIGRHIYKLSGSKWQRLTSAKKKIAKLFVQDTSHFVIATSKNQLYTGNLHGWRNIAISLDPNDNIEGLIGNQDGSTLAYTGQHQLFQIQAKHASKIKLPSEYENLDIQAVGNFQNNLLIAAQIGPKAKRRSVLFTIANSTPVVLDYLPNLKGDDRFSLVFSDHHGNLLVASEQGQVSLRSLRGQWSRPWLKDHAPAAPEDFPQSQPAHSR